MIKINNNSEIDIDTSKGTPYYIYSVLGNSYPITFREEHYALANRGSHTFLGYAATVNIDKLHMGFGKTKEEAVKDLGDRLKKLYG